MWKRKGLHVPFTNNEYNFYFNQSYFLFQMARQFVILVTLLLEEERSPFWVVINEVSRAKHEMIWKAVMKVCCTYCLHLCLPLGADMDPKMQSHRDKVHWHHFNSTNTFEYPCAHCHVRCWVIDRTEIERAPWTAACQAPLSMGFSRQEYWTGLPFPSPGDLPDPGIKPRSPILQADSLLSEPLGKPNR